MNFSGIPAPIPTMVCLSLGAPVSTRANAGHRPARPGASDEEIHLAIGLVPDLRPGAVHVGSRVVWVLELKRRPVVLVFAEQVGKVGEHVFNHWPPGCPSREMNVGPKLPADDVTLHHGRQLGHDDYALVPLGCAHHGDAYARISRGGLDDGRAAGVDLASFLGSLNHTEGDAVLDRAAWVLHLKFGKHALGFAIRANHAVELHHRRVPDGLRHIPADLGREMARPTKRQETSVSQHGRGRDAAGVGPSATRAEEARDERVRDLSHCRSADLE
eukprot:scaffold9336_cov133-Isochrysis_galbana.AAC.7